ncbi:hypothetical protein [Neisseria bacilliformis]|jgi:hypothetical protein|uniref:DUF7716 domain-containing protein n=1 Tax=Neisseria bacilliformis TaxID=267212 RepID=UPI0028ED5B50|nr:hypothetical protein [Neisseria bacilliformis]
MPTAQLRHPYTLAELIAIAAAEYRNSPDTRGSFEYADLFAAPDAPIAADTVCLLDEPLDEGTFDEDDNPEGYSDFVFDKGLELFYYGQQFADAVANTLHQKSGATTEDILLNLDYYAQHDTYLDF